MSKQFMQYLGWYEDGLITWEELENHWDWLEFFVFSIRCKDLDLK